MFVGVYALDAFYFAASEVRNAPITVHASLFLWPVAWRHSSRITEE